MTANDSETNLLFERAVAGDEAAFGELFARYRDRLNRMVNLRLDRRLQGRVDADDVLQEAYIDLVQRLPDYAQERSIPLFLWLRLVTGQRLAQVHRKHLGTAMRNAGREVSLFRGALPQASTHHLASQLLGHFTSVSQQAIRVETQVKLQNTASPDAAVLLGTVIVRHAQNVSLLQGMRLVQQGTWQFGTVADGNATREQ